MLEKIPILNWFIPASRMEIWKMRKEIEDLTATQQEIYNDFKDLRNTFNGIRGREIKVENEERLQEALARAATIFQNQEIPQDKKMSTIMQTIMAEYPDVAGKLLKMVMSGKLKF